MFIFTLSLEEFPVCGPERPNDLIRGARLNGKRQTPQPDVFPQPWPSDKNHTEICKTSKYAAPHASNIFRHNSQEGEEKKKEKKEKETNVSLLKTVFFSFIFQDWGQKNAVAAYAISLSICDSNGHVWDIHVHAYHFYV